MKTIIYTITKYICLKHSIEAVPVAWGQKTDIYCFECNRYLEIREYRIEVKTKKEEVK